MFGVEEGLIQQPLHVLIGGGVVDEGTLAAAFHKAGESQFGEVLADRSRCDVVTKRKPTDEEWKAMSLAFTVVKHVKSNAIVYANAVQTVGVGAGQMSRVDAAKLAATKAVLPLAGTVVASDAFFPFRDGIDVIAGAGATAIIQPGGSVKDEEVVAAADEHGLAMVLTGVRHFRH